MLIAGNVIHVKYPVLEGFFNIPINKSLPVIFVEDAVIDKLKECNVENNSSKQTP